MNNISPNNRKIIDLTHTVAETIPLWPGSPAFQKNILCDYDHGCRVNTYNMVAGTGTHIDSPAHFIANGRGIADLTVNELVTSACVIDISQQVNTNADYQLTDNDIVQWEKQFGKIPSGAVVLANTGWSRYWPNEKKYQNKDNNGIMHFPGFSPEAAQLLLLRNIAGIGIDTLSLDAGINTTFPVHKIMLAADKYQIENLTNIDKLPATGAILIALPIKIQAATEAPARIIALI